MFCSKCGKQVADGAAFCDGCGNSLNGAAPVATASSSFPVSKMSADEKDKKLRAVLVYVISAFVGMFCLWLVVATRFGCMSFMFEGAASRWAIEGFLESSFEDYGGILIMISIIMTLALIVMGIVHYYLPYRKRDFASAEKQLYTGCIVDIVLILSASCGFFFLVSSALNVQPYLLLVFGAFFAAVQVFVIISYKRAVKAETYSKWKENLSDDEMRYKGEEKYSSKNVLSRSRRSVSNHNGVGATSRTWECENCGTMNSNTDSFCKDCGNYK